MYETNWSSDFYLHEFINIPRLRFSHFVIDTIGDRTSCNTEVIRLVIWNYSLITPWIVLQSVLLPLLIVPKNSSDIKMKEKSTYSNIPLILPTLPLPHFLGCLPSSQTYNPLFDKILDPPLHCLSYCSELIEVCVRVWTIQEEATSWHFLFTYFQSQWCKDQAHYLI